MKAGFMTVTSANVTKDVIYSLKPDCLGIFLRFCQEVTQEKCFFIACLREFDINVENMDVKTSG